jgi:peptidoglycan/LPS O-acetylase OafA/YrhL
LILIHPDPILHMLPKPKYIHNGCQIICKSTTLMQNASQTFAMKLRQPCTAIFSHDLFLGLIPSFVADIIRPDRRRRVSQLHETSYLDGLRGLACFAVFSYHYTDYNHKFLLEPYGSNAPGLDSSLLQLPFVRVVYAGAPMVHIFFVISGFALSYRPLKCLYDQAPFSPSRQMQNPSARAIAKCHSMLASSALRRPVRLFGPPLTLTLLDIGLVSLGFMRNFMLPKPSWSAQFSDWAFEAVNRVAWPWGWDDDAPRSRYNPHLWTIPIEFAHSMLLFLVLLVISRLRTALLRKVVLVLAMAYSLLLYGRWAAFEFLGGALLAELHLSTKASEQLVFSPTTQTLISFFFAKISTIIQLVVLAGAGYIISWPGAKAKTPIYTWMKLHTPSSFAEDDRADRFWFALAALGTVWACGCLGRIRRLLESGPVQYAGRISFAFYILQHPFLNICELPVLGAPFRPASQGALEQSGWGVRGLVGQRTPLQRTVCWFIGLCVLSSILMLLADVFSRTVDVLFVKAAKKLEKMLFLESEEKSETLPTTK